MAFGKIGESITRQVSNLKGVPKKTAAILITALLLNVGTPQEAPAQDKNFKDGVSNYEPSKQKKGKSLDEMIAEEKEKTAMILKITGGVFSLLVLGWWFALYDTIKVNKDIKEIEERLKDD